jgi:hypothetical protein
MPIAHLVDVTGGSEADSPVIEVKDCVVIEQEGIT